RLDGVPDIEGQNFEIIAQKVKRVAGFYKEMGKKIILPNLANLTQTWIGSEGDFTVTIENGQFRAVGSRMQMNALTGAGIFGSALGYAPQSAHVTVEYLGVV